MGSVLKDAEGWHSGLVDIGERGQVSSNDLEAVRKTLSSSFFFAGLMF